MKVGLFPGQGVPARAVLSALPERDPLVKTASEILCYDLRGRIEQVASRPRAVMATSLAQPAIYTASLAAWFASDGPCDVLLGHSLGEYAALVAGGALSFEHGLCVVQVRGEAMQKVAARANGGMVAIIGLDLGTVESIALESGVM